MVYLVNCKHASMLRILVDLLCAVRIDIELLIRCWRGNIAVLTNVCRDCLSLSTGKNLLRCSQWYK